MFMQRLIASLVLVPLVLVAIFLGTSWLLATILCLVVVLCAYEWTKLIPLKRVEFKLLYIVLTLLLLLVSHRVMDPWLNVSFFVWALVLIAILTFPSSQTYWGYKTIVALVGWLFLSAFSSAFVALFQHDRGRSFIVYVFFLIWATDIGAYLVGKRFGRHKLIPRVSPGKSFEGAIGGLIAALAVATAGVWSVYIDDANDIFLFFISTFFAGDDP
jgi:phosphatidate cytidylyltransferase